MAQKPEKILVDVIPAIKLPRDLEQIFTYHLPAALKQEVRCGSLVQIPFRRKIVSGVVQKTKPQKEKPDFKLKSVKSVWPEARFSEQAMELMRRISTYYYAPLSWSAKAMLPNRTTRAARAAPRFFPDFETSTTSQPQLNTSSEKIIGNRKTVLMHNLFNRKLKLYHHLIQRHTKTDSRKQTLLLFPENFDVQISAHFFIKRYGNEQISILSGELTDNQFFAEWLKAASGKARLILGTRRALFAPFQNLSLIIVDEEHSSSFKQWDQSPRYSAVQVASWLAELWHAAIIFSSPTPSLETFTLTQRPRSLHHLAVIQSPAPSKPQIIDMNAERQNDNFNLLSETLQSELLKTVYHHRQALLFTPRLGSYTALICKDCNHLASCDTCQNTLIEKSDYLYCTRCKKSSPLLTECPQCHGSNLQAFGSGIERVTEAVKEMFKEKNIRIATLGGGNQEISSATLQKIYRDFTTGKIDILIGTQMILKNWPQPNLTLLGVLLPESLFVQNFFRSQEKLRQLLQRFYAAAPHQKVIIQTNKPEHPFFEKLSQETYKQFLSSEIPVRQHSALKIPYPPFGKIIKLIYKHPDPTVAKKEAQYAYKTLKNFIDDRHLRAQVEIITPFAAQNYREHGKYRWHLILRHTLNLPLSTRNLLLAQTKKDWIFDIDPDEIL